ncbi:hypothetical protein FOTG_11459 [Fusarium oxysporum f. sp. vasinfectum 25433]|uniref:Fungal N-terminal domain-containing protein n=1 Tax=Fusarium oxysporum f. sp. vasinfectum 25433 TaxID=1089449 RepID=X0L418_FUSOX|nr:hypothetical protein FOTG_11459 [Fusarium oxysporum f. sp. vasinfectum 25433]
MGDPFSIATGVAGLISLGLTVCDGLHTYFSAINDRKDDIAIATQSLALFKFHIFTVKSSASKLSHRHSPAIDGLRLSLINCELQLKCLESLLSELMPTEDASLTKEIWRRQKLIARYPFDRKKLVQLEEYLSRANTTLSSFIQALNLDINIRMSDDLEAFKSSLEALDINTQTTLRMISTRLDFIRPKVEPSVLEVLSSRAGDRVTTTTSNSIFLHQAAVGVAETKTSFNGSERSFEDLTNAHSTPRYLQNAELEQRLCKKLADMDCTCGASNSKTSNRPASRTYRFWGGLTVSRQGDVRANHRPGCIFFQTTRKSISRTSLTYFGLLSLFSQSFTISLLQKYPAGPYSVSFGLQPCNIVKSSPAFQLFNIRSQSIYKIFNHNIAGLDPSHIAENFIKELRVIYRSGKASPFDVDQDGNNIAHMCLNACLYSFSFEEALKSSDIAIDAICKMLTYLADIGVPITASNFNQSNLLTLSIKSFRNLWVLPSLHKLVMNRDSNFYHAELAHNGPLTANIWFENGGKWARQLDTLCEYPEICEDIGFSELFLAVIKKDHASLQAILAEENSISNISQMDLYKRNILHASSNWPDGLRLLLQRQDVRPLMDMAPAPFFHPRPLDYALFYSKIYCNAPDQWTECDNCTCYVAVQLLLEADCSVTVGHGRPEILAGCSLKARKLFFKHLKDRRERLRNVALGILPKETLHQYGITANFLPDKTAPMLWNELQEAKGQRDRLVGLTNSLQPCSDRFSIQPKSLFEFPHYLQVAELALDYGLAPKDEKGVPTLLSGSYIVPNSLLGRLAEEVSVKYLDWLLRHDLNLELSLEPFRFSTFHRAAVFVGLRIFWSLRRVKRFDLLHQDVSISELQDSKILLPAICESKAQCNIPCPCSSSMFTRPLAHILPAMLRYRGDSHLTYFFSHIGEHIKLVVRSIDLLRLSECSSEHSYMAKCAIHILTMMSLGVRHLPICLTENYDDLEDLEGKEDWKEILDEDRELIDQLQALDEEFGEEFDLQDVPIAEFLRGYWVTRMEEVLGELNKPLTDDDRYDLWEAGVVLDENEADGSEFCIEYTDEEV